MFDQKSRGTAFLESLYEWLSVCEENTKEDANV